MGAPFLRLVSPGDERATIVHASPGLLVQLLHLVLTLVAVVFMIASSTLGFLSDALAQAGEVLARLAGQEVT